MSAHGASHGSSHDSHSSHPSFHGTHVAPHSTPHSSPHITPHYTTPHFNVAIHENLFHNNHFLSASHPSIFRENHLTYRNSFFNNNLLYYMTILHPKPANPSCYYMASSTVQDQDENVSTDNVSMVGVGIFIAVVVIFSLIFNKLTH